MDLLIIDWIILGRGLQCYICFEVMMSRLYSTLDSQRLTVNCGVSNSAKELEVVRTDRSIMLMFGFNDISR